MISLTSSRTKKEKEKTKNYNPHLPDLAAAGWEMLAKLVNTQSCLQ